MCVTIGQGAGVSTVLALLFRAADGALVAGLSDFETGLANPDAIFVNVQQLYSRVDEPDTCGSDHTQP